MLGPAPFKADVRRLYSRRRVSILESFCAASSRSHLKFLSKIREFSYSLKDLELLRRILSDGEFLKKVRHYRQINRSGPGNLHKPLGGNSASPDTFKRN
jgi:hypothetical protein